MGRVPCCEKVGLKKGRWTKEEDEILSSYIKANGEGSWRTLPKSAGLLRCGKSCRLRWMNYLKEDVKRGNISPEEEDIIVKLHAALGNRWSLIASHLNGRTDNEIKNYWNSHLSRSISTFRRSGGPSTPEIVDLAKVAAGLNRRGGPTNHPEPRRNNKPASSFANTTAEIGQPSSCPWEDDEVMVGEDGGSPETLNSLSMGGESESNGGNWEGEVKDFGRWVESELEELGSEIWGGSDDGAAWSCSWSWPWWGEAELEGQIGSCHDDLCTWLL